MHDFTLYYSLLIIYSTSCISNNCNDYSSLNYDYSINSNGNYYDYQQKHRQPQGVIKFIQQYETLPSRPSFQNYDYQY